MVLVALLAKICIFWLMSSSLCFAHAKQQRIQFYSEIAAPYYWLNTDGTSKGVNVEVAAALINHLKLDASIDHLPWARAFNEALNRPNVVLLATLRTKKREAQLQWLGQLHVVRASLVKLSDRQDLRVNSLEQAKDFSVGTIRGYGAADYLLANGFVEFGNLVLLPNTAQLWSMFYNGRIDLVVSSIVGGRYEIASNGLDPARIEEVLEISDLNLELQIATGKQTSPELVSLLRNGILELKQQGTFEQILRKWEIE